MGGLAGKAYRISHIGDGSSPTTPLDRVNGRFGGEGEWRGRRMRICDIIHSFDRLGGRRNDSGCFGRRDCAVLGPVGRMPGRRRLLRLHQAHTHAPLLLTRERVSSWRPPLFRAAAS